MLNCKKNLLVLPALMFALTITAQINKSDMKKKMWGDTDFTKTDIPEKWKNESAVILAKSYEYEVKKEILVNMVTENIYFHKRIKLQDKSAVNDYSELSFEGDFNNSIIWMGSEYTDIAIGIKVIKPNGKESEVNLKEAILNEVKQGFQKKQFKKVAVPDLEVGDIVDYYYVVDKKITGGGLEVLDPVFYLLQDEYPIVSQKLKAKILRQMYFNAKSINGAPDFKRTETDDEVFYQISFNNSEKLPENRIWSYPYRVIPTIKFQAFYITHQEMNWFKYYQFFLKDKKTVNSEVEINNMEKLGEQIYDSYTYSSTLKAEVIKYLDKKLGKKAQKDSIVKYAYYYLRKETGSYYDNVLMLNLSQILLEKKIKHDLIITVPNYVSDIADIIIPKEMSFLLKIEGNPDYYIGDFNLISYFKSINSNYQGANAYAYTNKKFNKNSVARKITIPVSGADNNKQLYKSHITFPENQFDSLQVDVTKCLTGDARDEEIGSLIAQQDYWKEIEKFNSIPPYKEKKLSAKEKQEAKLRLEQQQRDCEADVKKIFQNEFDQGEDFKIQSFKLLNMGIWDFSPELKYQASFKIGNMVKKMGPNYMVSVGKFITNQLELKKKDMERTINIYQPYARTFEYEISIEIPTGYNVKGIDKLNTNVTTDAGSFVSSATLQGQTLNIHAKKTYNHNFEKASDWSKLTAFIEAAYNFTQTNILLEKK